MIVIIVAVSILMLLAAVATVGGLVYAFRNDAERRWS